jgi:transcriptional regulator with XRE-family HTH domain
MTTDDGPIVPFNALAAEEIRVALARQRRSGAWLARQLGVSRSWVSYRLTGQQPIDLIDLERIADALGVGAPDLMPSSDRTRRPRDNRPAGRAFRPRTRRPVTHGKATR